MPQGADDLAVGVLLEASGGVSVRAAVRDASMFAGYGQRAVLVDEPDVDLDALVAAGVLGVGVVSTAGAVLSHPDPPVPALVTDQRASLLRRLVTAS